MATMATSHGLSVLTNSCIKSPVNPATGLSASFEERPIVPNRLNEKYVHYKAVDEAFDENEVGGRAGNFIRNVPMEEYASQLHLLSDDEFYDRLLALKQEQKKTLIKCEELYKQKLSKGRNDETQSAIDYQFEMQEHKPAMNGHVSDYEESMLVNGVTRSNVSDYFRDMSTKPPMPLRHGARTSYAILSESMPIRARAFQDRPSSAPVGWRQWHSQSFDEEEWRKHMLVSGDESGDDREMDRNSRTRSREDIDVALSKIDDMWDNFSVDDYITRGRRRHSSDSMSKKNKKKHTRLEDNWRHRLTIPQPFNMTLRDEMKEKKMTRAQYEVAQARLEKEKQEEVECQKKFKASPAPAHIYLPLYDEICEKNEARRRYVKEYCTDMLKSQVKPFNFMTREEEKQKHKATSAPVSPSPVRKEKTAFKAKPVPEYIYDNTVNEKLIEEEEYRKIRMRMRSQELMREASLPPNMAARERMKEQNQKAKAVRAAKRQQRFRPKINRHIPDYDALYGQFQKELARRKCEQESTVMEPFKLETHMIPSRRDRVLRDMERDEETRKENRWPYKSPRAPKFSESEQIYHGYAGAMPSSLDWIPTKANRGSQLRKSTTRDRLHSLTRHEEEELEEERRHRLRSTRLQKAIAEQAMAADSDRGRRETVRSRLRRMRESERERLDDYEKELQRIKEKVDRRPLLVERQSQVNAKKSAEKRFTETLRKAGLDENFVNSHSSATASRVLDISDSYDDTFEDSAGKSSDMD